MRWFILIFLFYIFHSAYGQSCCSGGSGNPMAGGALIGTLQKRQMETAGSFQYMSSDKFKSGSRDTASLVDRLQSNYSYARVSYGLTNELTMSLECGYFLNKTEIGLHRRDTIRSSGFGDLIVFPRYNIFSKLSGEIRKEVTLGMGYKIPLGHCNDSFVVYRNPYNNQRFYTTSPPTVQTTTGSQDFIFYGFLMRANTCKQFRIFSNLVYIKKGWNPLGQKFGDFASVGIFAGKTLFDKLALTLQIRGEWTGKMKHDANVDMLALYNIEVNSTGSRKLFCTPQISFTQNNFTFFALYDYPFYQYMNRVQIASQYQCTFGFSYRFSLKKKETE